MAMPSLLTPLVDAIGWRAACRALALVLPLLLLLGGMLLRDTPEAIGLLPDGDADLQGGDASTAQRDAALPRASESHGGSEPEGLAHVASLAKPINGYTLADHDEAPDDDERAACAAGDPALRAARDACLEDAAEMPRCRRDACLEDAAESRLRSRAAAAVALTSAPLAASSLSEACAHPLFWCLCAMELAWGIFNGGFNLSFISIVGSLGGDLSTLGASELSRDTFLIISLTQNAAKMLTGERHG